MYYIYKFTNKLNGKIYIGKTNNLARRKIEHFARSKTVINNHFYNAIKKYGFNNFESDILFECENEDEAYAQETNYISFYKSNDKNIGYNSTSGGEGLRGVSDETRKKMSENGKLRVGEKNSFFGKKHSEDTIKLFCEIKKQQITRNGTTKLTIEKAREIRVKYSLGKTKIELADEYGVDKPCIYRVISNRSFKE